MIDEKQRRALLERTYARLQVLESQLGRAHEPIAIVSMACHFPGGCTTPEALWEALVEERDVGSELPTDRGWRSDLHDPDPHAAGRVSTNRGGFLRDPALFDPALFGISPREAMAIDCQQRLLLETTWEACERAGLDPMGLRGQPIGVFTGAIYTDYASRFVEKPVEYEGHLGLGSALSVASGRVSYVFGLEGPAITVDTACSSSLVALHLAVAALQRDECELALAGGATVMSTPYPLLETSRQGGVAPDGRCKPFAAAADGIALSEGVGVVLLTRLSEARRRGLPVLAVVRGSAVNQDGRSQGLTAPNGPSQERVIRAAAAAASLDLTEIDVVEAHGTGTRLGDPIEAGALLATYGKRRPSDRPLRLGSLKSNFGHMQATAGIAGVMKIVLAMQHGRLPRSLHIDAPTPVVDWSEGGISLLTEAADWPRADRPRRAAVSSFGISGTNAHVILEEAPASQSVGAADAPAEPVALPLLLSGRDDAALRAQASRWSAWLSTTDAPWPAVVRTAALGRAGLKRRAAVLARDGQQAAALLRGLAEGRQDAHAVVLGEARERSGVVFVFPGQGSQWAGMGRALLAEEPVFAEAIAACDAALRPHTGWSLTAVLRGDAEAPALSTVDVIQPALFGMAYGLAAVWRSWGVEPAAVVGHSQGEVAAAVVSGALSLDDGARILAVRSRLVARLAGSGAMASVALPVDGVEQRLAARPGVGVAVVNSAASTVVAGDPDAVEALVVALEAEGIFCNRIATDYASHSAHVDVLLPELKAALQGLAPRAGTVPLVSTVTGEMLDGHELGADYWCTNLRAPVRLDRAVTKLIEGRHGVFVEMSPHPLLTLPIAQAVEPHGGVVVGSLLRDEPGRKRKAGRGQLLLALAALHGHGVSVGWSDILPKAPVVPELPTYAFQRQRYWLDAPTSSGDPATLGQARESHPLLSAAVWLPDGSLVMTGRLSQQSPAWVVDHAVNGQVLLPGTAFLDLAQHAAQRVGAVTVEELVLAAPMVVPARRALSLRVSVGPLPEGGWTVAVHARPEDAPEDLPWVAHAEGRLSAEVMAPDFDLTAWPPPGAEPIPLEGLYAKVAATGYEYGPRFQALAAAWRLGEVLYAEVAAPDALGEVEGFGLHPALLDAALHASLIDDGETLTLPFAWRRAALYAAGARTLRVRLTPNSEGQALAVADGGGAPIAQIAALQSRPVSAEALAATTSTRGHYRVEWIPAKTEPLDPARWTWVGDGPAPRGMARLAAQLDAVAAAATAAKPPLAGVVVRWPPGLAADPAAIGAETGRALSLLQAWLADEQLAGTRLVFLTENAVAVESGDGVAGWTHAPLWGLVASAQSEYPDRGLTLVDIDGSDASRAALAQSLAGGEPRIALRAGRALAPRLMRRPAGVPAREDARPLDREGTALITGGTGGLGASVARWLVKQHGIRHLLLLSRRGLSAPGAEALVEELRAAGAEALVVACDASDRTALAEVLDSIPAAHPLTAVVHTAGLIDDALLARLSSAQLTRVMRPKVDAALHLDALTPTHDLSAFVLFSSAAGVFGSPGQANYGAANVFLDALAARRRADGLPAVSLAWGEWGGGGMVATLTELDRARLRREGSLPMTHEEALSLFDSALAAPEALLVPMDFDARALERSGAAVPPLLSRLVRAPRRRVTASPERGGFAGRLSALPAHQREAEALGLVLKVAAAVLGHADPAAIGADTGFADLGLDSLMAVELRNRLRAETGLPLSATVAFDHPTPARLSRHLLAGLASTTVAPSQSAGVREAGDEPIAILGIGLRVPGGAEDLDGLWQVLTAERDTVGPAPVERVDLESLYDPDPDAPGRTYVREAAFLGDVAGFDPAFFAISPREARLIDPQHRLLLETSWEALERAGIAPGSLRDSATGVFVGIVPGKYEEVLDDPTGIASQDASFAAGRVAYTLGLQGPTLAVNTACSSSLVALHLAARALRNGECTLALAAGVHVILGTDGFTGMCRVRALAPDGRSKAFSAAADGFGCGEGAVVLVLARRSEAERRGFPILGLVRGTAINHGGASSGITVPNGVSQQKVIRAALQDAGLLPAAVDVVECHGTGTSLGDPIEVNALAAVYGEGRPADAPLLLGAVKTQVGHLEAAAGLAGVAKVLAALRHGALPPTLHTTPRNPHIEWDALAVEVVDAARPWPRGGRPRVAGVSSFGLSGTNAHVILEEPPAVASAVASAVDPAVASAALPLLLSARDEAALRAQAGRWAAWLEGTDAAWPAVVRTAATSRAALGRRAAVLAADGSQAAALLRGLAEGRAEARVVSGSGEAKSRGGIVFVFPGQGSQWAGMGRALLSEEPVFADAIAACDAALRPHTGWSLTAVLRGDAEAPGLDAVDVIQPALFGMAYGLSQVWRSWGVEPAAVVGHSQGEVAAAVVSGALSLEDGARIVAVRSRLVARLAGTGAMASVALAVTEVEQRLLGRTGLSVAVVNSADQTVVAGDPDAVETLLRALEAEGVFCRRIAVDYASHSAHVDALLPELRAALEGIKPRVGAVPLVSTVKGEVLDGHELDADYWCANLRSPVRLDRAVAKLLEGRHGVFVEMSPHPVLTVPVGAAVEERDGVVVGSLRRDEGSRGQLLQALATLHCHGVAVGWGDLLPRAPVVAELPTYAFQRQRYWLDAPARPSGSGDDEVFWRAVEAGDPAPLAEVLGLDAGSNAAVAAVLPLLSQWRGEHRARTETDGWRYRIRWTPVVGKKTSGAAPEGRILLLIPRALVDDAVVEALAEALAPVERRVVDEEAFELPKADGHRATVSLLALDDTPVAANGLVSRGLWGTASLARACHVAGCNAPVWVVTRGAVSVGPADPLRSPVQAMSWGLGQVIGLEHPAWWGGLVDLPEALGVEERGSLRALVREAGGEDQVALRGAGIHARRLVRAEAPRARRFRTSGTALVTGGTGVIGTAVARWLALRGAERVVLVSRRGRSPDVETRVRAVEATGVCVEVVACDVSDRAAVAALLDQLDRQGPPLRSVFHAAGLGVHGPVAAMDQASLEQAVAGKALAASHLDALLGERALDAFVSFSSGAAAWGGAEQGAYAAANAYLDALASSRAQRGKPALSIGWGMWDGEGIGDDAEERASFARIGVRSMAPERALQALEAALSAGETLLVVTAMDWARFAPTYCAARRRALLADLPEAVAALAEAAASEQASPWVERLSALPVHQRQAAAIELVLRAAAQALGHADPTALGAETGFADLGLDSLMAVELRNRLRAETGLSLSATVVFDHPTSRSLSEFLLSQLGLSRAVQQWSDDAVREKLAQVSVEALRDAGLLAALMALPDAARAERPQEAPSDLKQRITEADDTALVDLLEGMLGGDHE